MSGALAIVLARAGSKGVPRKNTRAIAGRPCIEWTLDHALASRLVSQVIVSSDDPDALAIARARGVIALARPAPLASDTARVDDAARDAVARAAPAPADTTPIVILYANVPVRPAGCIDAAIERLTASGADSVQSYQPVGKHHPWWTARVDAMGHVTPWEGPVLNHGVFRRQDLPPAFIPDGAVLAVTRRALEGRVPGVAPGPHAFFGATRLGIINPENSVVDIDSELDLRVADAILSAHVRPL